MPASTKLFDLIKSLSKSEKRYFRMRSTMQMKGEVNQYMRLFDEIDRQSQYDDDELMAAFSGEPIGKHFAEAKFYLYGAILKSLQAYHAADSHRFQINSLVQQASILFDKRLYDQCPALLAKAKKLALEHEEWSRLQVILQAEIKLVMVMTDFPDMHERLSALYNEMEQYAHFDADLRKHQRLYNGHYALYLAHGQPRSKSELERFRDLGNPNLWAERGQPLTHEARLYHIDSIALYSVLSYDYAAALDACRSIFEIKASERPKHDRPVQVSELHNVCASSIYARRFDQFFAYYPTLCKTVAAAAEQRVGANRIHTMGLLACVLILAGHFDRAATVISQIEALALMLDEITRTYHRDRLALIELAVRFGKGDYVRALDCANEVMNMKSQGENLQLLARSLALIIHFERRQYDLLEYLLKSTYKYLRSKEKLFGFERAVLDFIRRAVSVRSQSELELALTAMHERLNVLMNDPFENFPTMVIDLQSWIEAKITKRDFAAVVREKFTARHGDIFEIAEKHGAAAVLNLNEDGIPV